MRDLFEYRRIDSPKGLCALGPQWRELDARQSQPMLPLSHLWHVAWWESFGEDFELALGTVLLNGELVAVAPLYATETSERGLRLSTTQLASNGYSPFGDLLLAPDLCNNMIDEVLALIVEHNPCDLMRLHKLPANGVVAERASRKGSLPVCIGVEAVLQTPIISLEGGWQNYLQTLSSASRKTVRRKLKRLDCEAGLTVKQFRPKSSKDPILKDIVAVSGQSWKSETKSDLLTDIPGREFLLRLIDELGPEDAVSVWVLFDNGVPIAFELLLHYGGIVYPIRADYDQQFFKISPGSILMAYVLKNLFEHGNDHTYDCCGDNYDYLRIWSKKTRCYVDVELFSKSVRSKLAYSIKYRIAPLMRKVSRGIKRVGGREPLQAKRSSI